MKDAAIGPLFPLGGPVPPELIVGRSGDIDEVRRRLGEGLSAMLVGPRRIGKTTVCTAACQELKDSRAVVVEVDVPERPNSQALLQLIVDACSRISLQARGRAALRVARPTIEKILGDQGIPLDLSSLGAAGGDLPIRAVLGLPAVIARREKRRALLFLDELQRVERALDGMFGAPVHFGKLVDRLTLDPQIPLTSWRAPLTDRFASAGLVLPDKARERILTWSGGRPYATMAAARYTALSARKTSSAAVADFDVQMGIDEAERHLAADGA